MQAAGPGTDDKPGSSNFNPTNEMSTPLDDRV